ncbi:uncharacterized protein LOC134820051 isoform X3 [Bolinopsis microptera]|uniref:uncharacterized protein LOC134820051 isoform X3 n=1 Tax=Bolinopsis microptera TaxID=2820187 RepID=UPI00307A3981
MISMIPFSRERTMPPFSRQRTMPPVSIKEYRKLKEQEDKGRNSALSGFDVRKIKTAPPARKSSSRKSSFIFQRQPSKPEVRPFSESRKSQSVPTSPGPKTSPEPRTTKRTRDKPQTDYFKDRSYMSDVYSWARNGEEKSSEQIKGMELTETIMNYKPERPKKGVYQKSENDDPLRAGLGYEGYMDCLLRGRRHRLTRKQWLFPQGITSDLKNEQPTLVPVNSMVRE